MAKKHTGVKKDSATNRALAFSYTLSVTSWLSQTPIQRATYEKFHFRDLLVNIFHELDDEINKLVLQHLIRMEVGYQKRNVISLK